jgi:hypothetical protein
MSSASARTLARGGRSRPASWWRTHGKISEEASPTPRQTWPRCGSSIPVFLLSCARPARNRKADRTRY